MKKIVSLLLVFAISFSLITELGMGSYAYTAHSQSEAVSWANSQVGKSLDYDGVYGAQCVDLIKYYYKYLGVNPVTGNGSDYASNSLPSGWSRIKYYSGFVAQAGDIAVWSYLSSSAGHVGIVTSANSSGMNLVDQNGASSPAHVVKNCWKNYSSGTFYGVIRPNFPSSTSVENKYKTTRTSATNNIAFYSWNSYSGAKYYNLRAKKIEGSTEVEGDESVWCCSNTKATLELREGKYRVYAEAVTNSGVYKYSDDYITVTFKNPKLSASINGSNTKFSWTAYSGAHHYRLRIYKNKIWTTHVATYDNITSLTYNTTLEPGNYAALIEVFDSNNKNIYYGTAIKFKVEYKTTRTSRNNNIAFYSWPAHPRAQYYNLRVKRVEGDSWIDDGYSLWSLNGTSNHVELPEGKYVVYVDAITPDGACQYSIDTVEISCGDPKLTSSVSGNNVTFNWSTYSGADHYSLRIYKNRIWTESVSAYDNLTSRSKTVTLPKGDYAAFVEAYNSSDKSLQYSNAIKISVTSDLSTTCSHTYSSTVTKSATCTTAGTRKYTCSKCGYYYTSSIAALGHNMVKKISPATVNNNGTSYTGYITKSCTRCSAFESEHIVAVEIVKLSTERYVYNSAVKTPSVKVVDFDGKVLKKGTDYTLTYASGRKNVGKYAVKVNFKGNYTGSRTLYFKILPKGTALSKLTAGKKAFNAKWKRQTAQTSGYQLQYSTNAKYSGAKTVAVKNPKAFSKTIKGLTAKKYYVARIRTYKTVNGVNYFSAWSRSLKVKTK